MNLGLVGFLNSEVLKFLASFMKFSSEISVKVEETTSRLINIWTTGYAV